MDWMIKTNTFIIVLIKKKICIVMTTKARASQILLTTIFAMILLSGIIIPASADADVTKINPNLPPNPNSIKSHIVSGDDVIFDNGAPSDEVINSLTCCVFADDFDFSEDQLLTDVHFWTQESGPWDNTLEYFIFEDDGGLPGSLITSGNGANIQKVDTGFAGFGGERFEYSFDLEDPVLLDGGIKFWFGLHLQDGFVSAPFTIKWEGSCVFCGLFHLLELLIIG